jgi:hypothetical protein
MPFDPTFAAAGAATTTPATPAMTTPGTAGTTMTERSGGMAVVTVAGAVFCVVLIFLALQIRAGRDPAIGAKTQTAQAPRQVIVRRIIVRRIVEEDAPAAPAPAASQSAPAASQAAPAPAPAPVVSGGS